jgi:hypothetical protein
MRGIRCSSWKDVWLTLTSPPDELSLYLPPSSPRTSHIIIQALSCKPPQTKISLLYHEHELKAHVFVAHLPNTAALPVRVHGAASQGVHIVAFLGPWLRGQCLVVHTKLILPERGREFSSHLTSPHFTRISHYHSKHSLKTSFSQTTLLFAGYVSASIARSLEPKVGRESVQH